MNRFDRHVTSRVLDYAWAYRLRLGHVIRRPDPLELQTGEGGPVLLLPGVYESWHFLETVGRHLHAAGHPVHTIPDFGRNIRPIAESARIASDYLVAHGLRNVSIVGHSKGGLIGKTLMLTEVGEARVALMVAIASPFGGSDYAHLVPLPTLREFVPTHETIVTLSAAAEVNSRIMSIFSAWDPIIPNGSRLEGATNIELPTSGHFRLLDRPDLIDAVTRAVGNA